MSCLIYPRGWLSVNESYKRLFITFSHSMLLALVVIVQAIEIFIEIST